jgi:hypothetical protein
LQIRWLDIVPEVFEQSAAVADDDERANAIGTLRELFA